MDSFFARYNSITESVKEAISKLKISQIKEVQDVFQQSYHLEINAPTVKEIHGTYRDNEVIMHLNPNTNVVVLQKPNGHFISAWELTPDQIMNVLTKGKL